MASGEVTLHGIPEETSSRMELSKEEGTDVRHTNPKVSGSRNRKFTKEQKNVEATWIPSAEWREMHSLKKNKKSSKPFKEAAAGYGGWSGKRAVFNQHFFCRQR